jgi:hypothetical protein
MQRFIFPRWVNKFMALMGILIISGVAVYATPLFLGATSPVTLNEGYQPVQPVPFSHALHAGELKMDCRYCHVSVDKWAHSTVPATKTCINCHSPKTPEGAPVLSAVHSESAKLKPIHDSWRTGESVNWVRIHRLPDFVFFNHSAHVNRGVSCVSCHGRVDKMDVVYQAKDQSMAWCIDCHKNPAPNLRPTEFVTKLDWTAADIDPADPELGKFANDPIALGEHLKTQKNINPLVNCATCHR